MIFCQFCAAKKKKSVTQSETLQLAIVGYAQTNSPHFPAKKHSANSSPSSSSISLGSTNDSSSVVTNGDGGNNRENNGTFDGTFNGTRDGTYDGTRDVTLGDDDVFQDVEEKKDEEDVFKKPFEQSSSKSNNNIGVRKRSTVKASGEELVRQLQELERNSR